VVVLLPRQNVRREHVNGRMQHAAVLHCVCVDDDEYNVGGRTSSVVQLPVVFSNAKQMTWFLHDLRDWVKQFGGGIVKAATGASARALRSHGFKPQVFITKNSRGKWCSVTLARFQGREHVAVGFYPSTEELHGVAFAAKYDDPAVAAALLAGAKHYVRGWLEQMSKDILREA
jgi:hypothetical protein